MQAADTYRDQLQPDEQATLDAYLKELAKAKAVVAAGSGGGGPGGHPAGDGAGRCSASLPAGATGCDPVARPASRRLPVRPPANQLPPTVDTKQRGRWLLHEAREQLHLGNYDLAQQKVDEAEALDIKWGLFDDTPAKVTEEIKKSRPKVAAASAKTAANQPHDRRTARNKLQEARTALDNRQFEQAEAIALDVKRWGLTYGLFEDNPDKVAAAARALRRRDKIRNTPPREQSSQGVYDILVQESRQLMSVGKLDEAEAKARMAQRMNVVPPLTADRAESVLHEIAMARAQTGAGGDRVATGRGGPPVSKMEREANELLAKGDQEAAAAKFSEAERLSAGESLAAVNARQSVPDRPASDPAVQQIAATGSEPGTRPGRAGGQSGAAPAA